MADNTRYTKNRNLWRKTYGFRRRKPNTVVLQDGATGKEYTLDLNKTSRERNPYLIKAGTLGALGQAFDTGEYDEGIISFMNSDEETGAFNFTFSASPIVVLTLETDPDVIVNTFGITVTDSGITVGTSAPFSGSVRYRAIYAPSYPAIVSSPYSSSFIATAGESDLVNEDAFSLAFNTGVGTPASQPRVSVWDDNGNFDADVAHNITNLTSNIINGTIAGTLSAPTTSEINFIVVL